MSTAPSEKFGTTSARTAGASAEPSRYLGRSAARRTRTCRRPCPGPWPMHQRRLSMTTPGWVKSTTTSHPASASRESPRRPGGQLQIRAARPARLAGLSPIRPWAPSTPTLIMRSPSSLPPSGLIGCPRSSGGARSGRSSSNGPTTASAFGRAEDVRGNLAHVIVGDGLDRREDLVDRLQGRVHQLGLAEPAHPGGRVLQPEHDRRRGAGPCPVPAPRRSARPRPPWRPRPGRSTAPRRPWPAGSPRRCPTCPVSACCEAEAVHRVGQAALLPHLLEQPGRHAAAQRGVEHAEREPAVVGPGQPCAAEHQVRLLDPARDQPDARSRPRAAARGPPAAAAAAGGRPPAERRAERLLRPGPRPASWSRLPGRRDDQVIRGVPGPVVLGDLVAGDRVDRVHVPRIGRPSGVSPNSCAVNASCTVSEGSSSFMAISSRITPRSASTSFGVDQRAGHHVGQHVDGQRQVGVQHPRVVARVLLGGERVELAADRVHRRRDLQRGAPRRCP